jgi:hypothetical protein
MGHGASLVDDGPRIVLLTEVAVFPLMKLIEGKIHKPD